VGGPAAQHPAAPRNRRTAERERGRSGTRTRTVSHCFSRMSDHRIPLSKVVRPAYNVRERNMQSLSAGGEGGGCSDLPDRTSRRRPPVQAGKVRARVRPGAVRERGGFHGGAGRCLQPGGAEEGDQEGRRGRPRVRRDAAGARLDDRGQGRARRHGPDRDRQWGSQPRDADLRLGQPRRLTRALVARCEPMVAARPGRSCPDLTRAPGSHGSSGQARGRQHGDQAWDFHHWTSAAQESILMVDGAVAGWCFGVVKPNEPGSGLRGRGLRAGVRVRPGGRPGRYFGLARIRLWIRLEVSQRPPPAFCTWW